MKKWFVKMGLLFTILFTLSGPLVTNVVFADEDIKTDNGTPTIISTEESDDLKIDNNLSVQNNQFFDTNVNFQKFDQYISFENNHYTLNLPSDNLFPAQEIAAVNDQIKFSNTLILENKATLDEKTGTATIIIPSENMARSLGSTYVRIYWNYIHVGIERYLVRTGVSAAAGAIAGSIATYYSFGAATTFVSRVVGALIGAWAASKIHSGIWFHLNYAYGINAFGWQ